MTVFLKSMEKINKRHLLVKAELLPRPVPQDQKVVRDLKALKKERIRLISIVENISIFILNY